MDKGRRPIVDNEKFITLMQVASEKPDVRKRLMTILTLDRFNRQSLLNNQSL
ncbi:MAG: hypothetical protein ABII06_18060 [Pseudomonadota bacterium]